jgi:hypothetical protein
MINSFLFNGFFIFLNKVFGPVVNYYLLQEDGNYLLQEDGNKIIL